MRMLDSWLRRRERLRGIGVRVPILYSAFAGTLYEEYIESKLFEPLSYSEALAADVAKTAALVDCAGFETLSFLDDLRTQNGKAYYVDFGFDLGSQLEYPTNVPEQTSKKDYPTLLDQLA